MRQVGPVIADFVDIEKTGAGYMGCVIFGLWITVGPGKIPGRVDDAQIRVFQMGGQPGRGDKCFRVVLHRVPHIQFTECLNPVMVIDKRGEAAHRARSGQDRRGGNSARVCQSTSSDQRLSFSKRCF